MDARRGCRAGRSAQKAAPAEGGASQGSGRRIQLTNHQRRSGAPRRLHVTEVSSCPGRRDRQGGTHQLALREPARQGHSSRYPRIGEVPRGYLGLSAFGELDNAFNTPTTFDAVKCHNCVVGITAIRLQCKRMQLSARVCHLPRSDVYELRKKKRWSVLIGE